MNLVKHIAVRALPRRYLSNRGKDRYRIATNPNLRNISFYDCSRSDRTNTNCQPYQTRTRSRIFHRQSPYFPLRVFLIYVRGYPLCVRETTFGKLHKEYLFFLHNHVCLCIAFWKEM